MRSRKPFFSRARRGLGGRLRILGPLHSMYVRGALARPGGGVAPRTVGRAPRAVCAHASGVTRAPQRGNARAPAGPRVRASGATRARQRGNARASGAARACPRGPWPCAPRARASGATRAPRLGVAGGFWGQAAAHPSLRTEVGHPCFCRGSNAGGRPRCPLRRRPLAAGGLRHRPRWSWGGAARPKLCSAALRPMRGACAALAHQRHRAPVPAAARAVCPLVFVLPAVSMSLVLPSFSLSLSLSLSLSDRPRPRPQT